AIPSYTVRSYADFSAQTFGEHVSSFPIEHRGRTFYYGSERNARAANELLDAAERVSQPGDRVFVGTKDLRKTPLSEAYFYYLLPQLEVATYYIEMDPGVANAPDSGLANDVRSADILILSSAWEDWDEPNDSRKLGSAKPNRVVRDKFCLVDRFGAHYWLYERCGGRADRPTSEASR
ncbi:MAG: hypothetical protein WEA81_07345, partial [Dehalococcoidia bacterium]